MSDLPAIQPDMIQFGNRTIRLIGYQPVANSLLIAAIVVIEPSTLDTSPDIVLGFGRVDFEAKADAFETAKNQIRKNTRRTNGK